MLCQGKYGVVESGPHSRGAVTCYKPMRRCPDCGTVGCDNESCPNHRFGWNGCQVCGSRHMGNMT